MKDIMFKKDADSVNFFFLFKTAAQILMSILSAVMIGTFAIFYALRPYSDISDNSYFMIVFFIASLLTFKMYHRYKWLSVRKRLEIKDGELIFYLADALLNTIPVSEVDDVVIDKEMVLIFPLHCIRIQGKDDEINIIGFKGGEDLTGTHEKLRELILQKNQG
jgi:hypothetical protein